MAGESALLAMLGQGDLSGFTQNALAGNLFSQLAPSILGAKFDTSSWSPGTSAGVSFGKALLGGLANNYGRNQVADETSAVSKILPDLYADPMSVAAPEGVDKYAFSQLQNKAVSDNLLRMAAQKATKEDDVRSTIKSLLGVGVQSGEMSASKALSIAASDDPKAAMLESTGGGYSKYTPEQLNELGLKEGANKDQVELALKAKSSAFDTKIKLNDEVGKTNTFLKTGGVGEQYNSIKPNFDNMIANLDLNSGASDIAFMNAFQKTVDEKGVVRGEDIKTIADAQSYLDSYFGKASNALDGSGRLKIGAKLKLLEAAGGKINSVGSAFESLKKQEQTRLESLQQGLGNQISAPSYSNFDFSSTLKSKVANDYAALLQSGMDALIARNTVKSRYEGF